MSTETNKAIVRRWVAAINEQNLAELDTVLAPDLAQKWKNVTLPWLYNTFADHHIEITDLLAEGEQMAVWCNTSGQHSSEFEGLPPTGRRWTNKGVYLLRLHEGKIVEARGLFDGLNLIKQLGITITLSTK